MLEVATTNEEDVGGLFLVHFDFPKRNIFGWDLIEVGENISDGSSQTIEFPGSAVAFGASNIIIGQNAVAVAEPSSSVVLATLLGLGDDAQRRKRYAYLMAPIG